MELKPRIVCRKCGVELIIGDNWYESHARIPNNMCKQCVRDATREWQLQNAEKCREHSKKFYYKHGGTSMDSNRKCPMFLGVHVAERVLSKVFKKVEVMPHGHKGYDFICNKGKKIDVKSSCTLKRGSGNGWIFNIKHNTTADYFLCIAFDNRDDLNPLRMWLIPGDKLNSLTSASVTESNVNKWDKYSLSIDKVYKCCNTLKE